MLAWEERGNACVEDDGRGGLGLWDDEGRLGESVGRNDMGVAFEEIEIETELSLNCWSDAVMFSCNSCSGRCHI